MSGCSPISKHRTRLGDGSQGPTLKESMLFSMTAIAEYRTYMTMLGVNCLGVIRVDC